jgi:hypothetical protein
MRNRPKWRKDLEIADCKRSALTVRPQEEGEEHLFDYLGGYSAMAVVKYSVCWVVQIPELPSGCTR